MLFLVHGIFESFRTWQNLYMTMAVDKAYASVTRSGTRSKSWVLLLTWKITYIFHLLQTIDCYGNILCKPERIISRVEKILSCPTAWDKLMCYLKACQRNILNVISTPSKHISIPVFSKWYEEMQSILLSNVFRGYLLQNRHPNCLVKDIPNPMWQARMTQGISKWIIHFYNKCIKVYKMYTFCTFWLFET